MAWSVNGEAIMSRKEVENQRLEKMKRDIPLITKPIVEAVPHLSVQNGRRWLEGLENCSCDDAMARLMNESLGDATCDYVVESFWNHAGVESRQQLEIRLVDPATEKYDAALSCLAPLDYTAPERSFFDPGVGVGVGVGVTLLFVAMWNLVSHFLLPLFSTRHAHLPFSRV